MSQPITWRGITRTASMDGAAQSMLNAQNSFQNAIAAAQKGVQNYEAGEEAIRGRLMKAQEQAYLDTLQGAGSVEQLEQLRTSGKLDPMLAALDPESRARVRGAADSRLTALREQTIAGQAYAHNQLVEQQKPLHTQISTLLADRNPVSQAKAKELIAANPNLIGVEKLMAQVGANEDAATQRTRADARWNWDTASQTHTAAVRKLELSAAEQKAKDDEERRKAEALVNKEVTDRQADWASRSATINKLAAQLNNNNFPGPGGTALAYSFKRDGSLDWEGMSSAHKNALAAAIKVEGLGDIKDYLPNDTERVAGAISRLRAAGVKESHLANLIPVLTNGFSTAPLGAVGRDLHKIAYNEAAQEEVDQAMRNRSFTLAHQADRFALKNKVRESVAKFASEAAGVFSNKSWKVDAWNKSIDKFLEEGIPVLDEKGKPVIRDGVAMKMLPTADILESLLAQAQADRETLGLWNVLGGDAQRAESLDRVIQRFRNDPETLRSARDSYNLESAATIQRANKLDMRPKSGDAPEKKK